jgi:hypothetical protein
VLFVCTYVCLLYTLNFANLELLLKNVVFISPEGLEFGYFHCTNIALGPCLVQPAVHLLIECVLRSWIILS